MSDSARSPLRRRILTIEKRGERRQSVRLEAIELLHYLETAEQRSALRNTILGIKHWGKTVPPRVQSLSDRRNRFINFHGGLD
jgi:hypothetical protein